MYNRCALQQRNVLPFIWKRRAVSPVVPRMIKLRGLSLPQISLTCAHYSSVCGAKPWCRGVNPINRPTTFDIVHPSFTSTAHSTPLRVASHVITSSHIHVSYYTSTVIIANILYSWNYTILLYTSCLTHLSTLADAFQDKLKCNATVVQRKRWKLLIWTKGGLRCHNISLGFIIFFRWLFSPCFPLWQLFILVTVPVRRHVSFGCVWRKRSTAPPCITIKQFTLTHFLPVLNYRRGDARLVLNIYYYRHVCVYFVSLCVALLLKSMRCENTDCIQ